MSQAIFRASVLDAALPVPPGLIDAKGRPAGRRFAVYRNNVAVGLTVALEDGFPLLRQLLGAEFFSAMAGIFLRAHPPTSRILSGYGDAMPDFLSGFPPLAHLPYLPDVARLELALRESYHAADGHPVAADHLALVPTERLMTARLRLAPALRLVRSDWPLHGIWAAHHGGPPPVPRAEDCVVLRPGFDPAPLLMPPGGGTFVAALLDAHTVGEAMAAAGDAHDLGATFACLLGGGGITDIVWDLT